MVSFTPKLIKVSRHRHSVASNTPKALWIVSMIIHSALLTTVTVTTELQRIQRQQRHIDLLPSCKADV